jgi:dUTP pyrophosphatase
MAKIIKTSKGARVPEKGSPGAAGFDLFSLADVKIPAKGWKGVDTGIAIQPKKGYYARVGKTKS